MIIPRVQPEMDLFPPQPPNYSGLFHPAKERDSIPGNAFRNGLEPLPQFLQLLNCHHSRPKAGPQLGSPSSYPETELKREATYLMSSPGYWSQTPASGFPECSPQERPRHGSQGTLFPPGFKWQNSESPSSHGEA